MGTVEQLKQFHKDYPGTNSRHKQALMLAQVRIDCPGRPELHEQVGQLIHQDGKTEKLEGHDLPYELGYPFGGKIQAQKENGKKRSYQVRLADGTQHTVLGERLRRNIVGSYHEHKIATPQLPQAKISYTWEMNWDSLI